MNDVTEEVDGITFVPGAEERGCKSVRLCVGVCASPGKPFLVFTYVWSMDGGGRGDWVGLAYVSEGMNQDLQGVYTLRATVNITEKVVEPISRVYNT